MLFRKKIEHACAHCIHGVKLDDGVILCAKRGVRTEDQKCFRFKYDPIKRIPRKAKALDFSKYDREDYSL